VITPSFVHSFPLPRWRPTLPTLRGKSMIRYTLPALGFSESRIHLASATGEPLGFLWIHVQGLITLAKNNLDLGFLSSLRGLPT